MNLRTYVRQARDRLVAAGIAPEEAAFDAELLARDVLGWDRAALLARMSDPAPPAFAVSYDALVERRATREPMAYIRGRQEFWGRDFRVGPGVLIPRPETEILIEEALAWAAARVPRPDPLRILDIGTGSGCLAITLALELPRTEVWATDVSADALAVARANAAALEARVAFVYGAWAASVPGPVDLLVSNPPYVPTSEWRALAPEVRDHEPITALTAGADGLDAVRQVVTTAAAVLVPEGRLLMEFGYGQADAVARIVTDAADLELVRTREDLQGIPRVAVATRRMP